MNDNGSETSEKVAGATDTATWPSELRQKVDEFEKDSKEKTEATKKVMTTMFESVRHSLFPDIAKNKTVTGGGITSGRGGRGGGRTNGRN
jgi:hypothetical protein